MLLELVFGLIIFLFLLHKYISRNWDYWSIRGVEYMKPFPFVGGMKDRILMTKSFFDFDKDNYMYFKGKPYGGYFEGPTPVLYVIDPDLIKQITIKDFNYFVNRRAFGEGDKLMSNMVSTMKNQQWRDTRSIMTPAFSSGKMKRIFETVQNSSEKCVKYLRNYSKSGKEIEMKEFFGKYSMDVIATAAFGVDCNSIEVPESEFTKNAAKVLEFGIIKGIILNIMFMMPTLSKILGLSMFDPTACKFFEDVVTNTIKYRENNDVKGKDFLQLLTEARKGELQDDPEGDDVTHKADESTKLKAKQILSDSVLLAQAVLFFIAGYENGATLLTFACYELALNEDIQERLHKEIKDVANQNGGNITYNGIMEMPYLDMVVNETQRRHVSSTRFERIAAKDYKVPNHNLTIEKDSVVIISVAGLHWDPEYFPNPEKFDPERFTPENKAKRNPYVFAPFGIGPRNCIGNRFALMEVKAAIANIILHLKLKTCAKTQIPLIYDTKSLFLKGTKGIWLKVEGREE